MDDQVLAVGLNGLQLRPRLPLLPGTAQNATVYGLALAGQLHQSGEEGRSSRIYIQVLQSVEMSVNLLSSCMSATAFLALFSVP